MTLLGGRYTLDVPLGDSDLGTVWNAHDDAGTLLVVVTLEDDAPDALKQRFSAHAKALLATRHPSLVRAIAEGEENGSPYLVLERLKGESLAARLESGPAPTVARIVEIATALADALGAVHAAGIAHGDVEPGNVLLVTEDGKEVPKLIGFGLNRASLRQELGVRMSVPSLGPVAYAAPEQARGDLLDSPQADQASLAALVYAALGGRPPHVARDVAALASAIGNEKPTLLSLVRRELAPFASTIDRALSSDPKKRFADMAAFARAIKTAGSMARTIAATPVPLGARSGIGEPPAPALPRAATIPKPGGGLGARVPSPGKVAIPRPGAAAAAPVVARPAGESSRTTEELLTADLLPVAPAAAEPSKTSTPQPPPKSPAHPKGPPPATTPKTARATEELDVSELQVDSVPPPAEGAPTDEVAKPDEAAAKDASDAKDVSDAKAARDANDASDATASEGEGAAPAPRESLPELAVELQSLPPSPPAEAPPPPPAAKTSEEGAPADADDEARERAAAAIEAQSDAPAAEAPKPPPPPAPDKAAKADWKSEKKPRAEAPAKADEKAAPKDPLAPSIDPFGPPASEPDADVDVPAGVGASGGRPWLVPVAIAAVALLAIVSWFGYQATQSGAADDVAGHTLTVTPPETSTLATTVGTPPETTTVTPPETTVEAPPETTVEAPPETTVEAPPETTVAAPPETTAPPPPATRVTPPPATRTTTTRPPPATRTTTTRPPPATRTTTTRPPPATRTTTTRPPPTSTTRTPPPPSTGRRPTVVSDPGF